MGRKIRYGVGIFLLIMALALFQDSILAGILMLIAGIACIPITYERLKITDKKKLQVILPILLFFVAIAATPTTETEPLKDKNNSTNQVMAAVENNEVNNTNITDDKVSNNSTDTEKVENKTTSNTVKEDTTSTKDIASSSTKDSNKTVSSSKSTNKNTSSSLSTKKKSSSSTSSQKKTTSSSSSKKNTSSSTKKETASSNKNGQTVYVTETGKRYHYLNNCGNGTYYKTTLSKAKERGLTPCQKCVH